MVVLALSLSLSLSLSTCISFPIVYFSFRKSTFLHKGNKYMHIHTPKKIKRKEIQGHDSSAQAWMITAG
jgi:hypothetical protein